MSSPFKDVVQNDIKNCFININEFSDIHTINNKSMPAMLDDVEANDREIKYIGFSGVRHTSQTEVYVKKTILYVAASDYGNMPAVGNALLLDGKRYRIFDVSAEDGIYAITLEAWDNGSSQNRR